MFTILTLWLVELVAWVSGAKARRRHLEARLDEVRQYYREQGLEMPARLRG